MRFGKTVLALAFTLCFILAAVLVPQPARASITDLELVPGKYTDTNIYVPGEVMDIVMHGDTINETYNIFIVTGSTEDQIGNQVSIQESMTAKISYEVPEIPDGEYLIRVKRVNGAVEAEAPFFIQGYNFNIETDRESYLSGDVMKIFWTANNIKDQTLPSSGVGRLEVFNRLPDGEVRRMLGPHLFEEAAGSVSFTLPDIVNYTHSFFVRGWFNDTAASPERIQSSTSDFDIKRLGVIIELDKNQYTAGSLLRMDVTALVTDNQANPSLTQDTPEPDCSISIEIKKGGSLTPTISPVVLTTDIHGLVEFLVALNHPDFADGEIFVVEVNAKRGINSVFETATFTISSSSSISVVLHTNRGQYASGETMFINVSASSIGDVTNPSYAYILEIRDNDTAGSLFSRETQTTGNFSFDIPDNFEGWLWARVTVDDGSGNSASVIQMVRVNYAIVLVNVNKEKYVAGDHLTITYQVIGDLTSQPATFYVVYDKENSVVEEGTATNGSFTFTVPNAPSKSYDFTVFASGNGRVVQGSHSAELFSGYVILLDFNRASYEPGDTMAINYRIIVMGSADIPATFTMNYGLANGPRSSLQTGDLEGSIIYVIPEKIDQGEQIFTASCDFGATSNEVVVVKEGANLLWYLKISDIPLFNIFLAFLVLLSVYWSLRTRSRLKKLESQGPQGPESSAAPRRSPQESSGQRFNCVECGDPIEITTSRRPIEVMCPHCGEIQHIE